MAWGTYFECELCGKTYKRPEMRVREDYIPEGWVRISWNWQRRGRNGTWKNEVFLVCGVDCGKSVLKLKKYNKIKPKDQ